MNRKANSKDGEAPTMGRRCRCREEGEVGALGDDEVFE